MASSHPQRTTPVPGVNLTPPLDTPQPLTAPAQSPPLDSQTLARRSCSNPPLPHAAGTTQGGPAPLRSTPPDKTASHCTPHPEWCPRAPPAARAGSSPASDSSNPAPSAASHAPWPNTNLAAPPSASCRSSAPLQTSPTRAPISQSASHAHSHPKTTAALKREGGRSWFQGRLCGGRWWCRYCSMGRRSITLLPLPPSLPPPPPPPRLHLFTHSTMPSAGPCWIERESWWLWP